jgi:transposase
VPRRLTVAPGLAPDELRRRSRAAPAADRVRWLAVRLVAEGRPATEVGPLVGFTPEWVRALVRRYNAGGPAALADGRRGNPGARPLLDAVQQEELRAALGGPAPGGGLWTCRSVAAWIGERVGRPVAEQRGWEWMRRLGFTPQRPRPREERADPAAQEAFKRGASRPRSTPSRPPTPGRR